MDPSNPYGNTSLSLLSNHFAIGNGGRQTGNKTGNWLADLSLPLDDRTVHPATLGTAKGQICRASKQENRRF